MKKNELYINKNLCCGCNACVNACPQKAINLIEDNGGFKYPEIDESKCVNCKICEKICAYKKQIKKQEIKAVYAGITKDSELLKKSSSGGVFAEIAKEFLNSEGIVYGCAFEKEDKELVPKHIRIDSVESLHKIQGSKYVNSFMGNCYEQIKNDLIKGKKVLFSGTPCQVDALKSYLKNTNTTDLYTVDIICHGTPDFGFFNEYIKQLEEKIKGKIIDIKFRDKTELNNSTSKNMYVGKITYLDKNNKIKYKVFLPSISSYYNMFLNAEIFRENCYTCKYTCKDRVGDITLGDYWGIEKVHPELVEMKSEVLSLGVSAVIVNSSKGEDILKTIPKEKLFLYESSFDKVSYENEQLKRPCKKSLEREKIMNLFEKDGYKAVEKYFFDKMGKKKYIYYAWDKVPRRLQLLIKKLKK